MSTTATITGEFSITGAWWFVANSQTSSDTWSFSMGSGASSGLFELDTWTMYHYYNASSLGNMPCVQNWVAKITSTSSDFLPYDLTTRTVPQVQSLGVGWFSAADPVSPHNIYSSVFFDNDYSVNNNGAISTCNFASPITRTLTSSTVTVSGVQVSISVSFGGATVSVSSLLDFGMSVSNTDGRSTSFTYTFPAYGGTWLLDQLTSNFNIWSTGPGALAFYWVPCNYVGGNEGGGCVATGTYILTPQGSVLVQSLSAGSTVSGYNVATGNLSSETIISIKSSHQISLIKINGDLLVTSKNQPMLIHSSTYLGFLMDPVNLTVGEDYFDPVAYHWVKITSLSTVTTSTVVYDIQVAGLFDFIVGEGTHQSGMEIKTHAGSGS